MYNVLRCIDYVGFFSSGKNWWLLSPARQIFKGKFHFLLWILQSKFDAQSETESLKGEFEALVHEYTQTMVFLQP